MTRRGWTCSPGGGTWRRCMDMRVDPAFRRKGIGEALLEAGAASGMGEGTDC